MIPSNSLQDELIFDLFSFSKLGTQKKSKEPLFISQAFTFAFNNPWLIERYMIKSIQDWTKLILWKTAFKGFEGIWSV